MAERTFSHSNYERWGKSYRLSFWRWGITLDWGTHRFILCVPASTTGSEQL